MGKQDLARLDEQLAQEAAESIKHAIAKPTGNRITTKNKEFILPDGRILGNTFNCVVVDFVSWNRYYTRPFQPNTPTPPVCYAVGKAIAEMKPMDSSPEKQSEDCKSCPMNQYKSDPKGGTGKACKNTRELAIILEEDAGKEDAPIYLLGVSPTAIKYFDAIVNLVARTLSGPPIKAEVSVFLNPNTDYPQVVFRDPKPNPNLQLHMSRRPEALIMLTAEPDLTGYVPPVPSARPAGRPLPPRAPLPRR